MLRDAGLQFRIAADSEDLNAADLLAISGGDGTIHRFLPQLLRARLPVLVIPSGSGNDFARSLTIPSVQIAGDLARRFVRGDARMRNVDIGIIRDQSANETPFCCVGGIGLDAIAAQFANRMPRWLRSHGGYLVSAARALLSAPSFRVKIRSDQREFEQDLCLFCFANTPSFGGGLRIAPDARLDDGMLDCVSVESLSQFQLVPKAFSLLRGTHLGLKEVTHSRIRTVQIESDPPTSVYADGEFVCKTPVEVSVLTRALKVLCAR